MFPGPEKIGTHSALACGTSLAFCWPSIQPPDHPGLALRGFTHVQVTAPAQSPSALQALGTVPLLEIEAEVKG